jgi:hypothetical protein
MDRKFSVTVAIPLSCQLLEPGVPWHSVAYYFVVFILRDVFDDEYMCQILARHCTEHKVVCFQ